TAPVRKSWPPEGSRGPTRRKAGRWKSPDSQLAEKLVVGSLRAANPPKSWPLEVSGRPTHRKAGRRKSPDGQFTEKLAIGSLRTADLTKSRRLEVSNCLDAGITVGQSSVPIPSNRFGRTTVESSGSITNFFWSDRLSDDNTKRGI